MIFLSAGHHAKDPGAVANGFKESELAIELRGQIARHLNALGASFRMDDDQETLAEYLRRIQPGSGSVVCELHFNAGPPTATGVETIVPFRATPQEISLAKELSAVVSKHTGLVRRGKEGVISEAQSQHGRLALMREDGMNALLEVCFISNANDLRLYRRKLPDIAKDIAAVLHRYDAHAA